MNYGLQISASGLMTSMYRQDVAANNLANINTAGFKPDIACVRMRDAAAIEDGLGTLPSNKLLEKLGAGVMLAPNRINQTQGSIQTTNDPMNVAIKGDGYFVIRDAADKDTNRVRLTRDGRFGRNSTGRLVLASTGQPVLDSTDKPIEIPDSAPITIQPSGSIVQKGQEIARLQVIEVGDKTRLRKIGEGLFSADADTISSRRRASGQVIQGAIESSAIDEVKALLDVQAASRDVEGNISMMKAHDRTIDRAINQFGRL